MSIIEHGNNQSIEKVKLSSIIDNIEKPSYQRNLDIYRLNDIKEYIIKQKEIYETYPFLGLITIVKFNKKLYCIDGQHRLGAYQELLEKDSNLEICIDFRVLDNYQKIRDLYCSINKSVIVPDYLLYEENEKARDIIKNGISKFRETYDTYFVKKPTTRKAYRPSIKENDFVDVIFHSDYKFKDSEELYDYLLKVNSFLSDNSYEGIYNLSLIHI